MTFHDTCLDLESQLDELLSPEELERIREAECKAAMDLSIRQALCTLEQIAARSTDKSSRALADGAAGYLRAALPAELLS